MADIFPFGCFFLFVHLSVVKKRTNDVYELRIHIHINFIYKIDLRNQSNNRSMSLKTPYMYLHEKN